MKYFWCALLLLCIPALLVTQWVAFPLSRQLSGIAFSMVGYVRGHMHPTPLSYGGAATLILLVAAGAVLIQRWTWVYAAGMALMTLTVAAPFQVAFGNPALLKDLAEEADWLNAAYHFAQSYLPLNLGNEATVWPFLTFDTLAGRLLSRWYFMGLGWYLAIIVAIALMVAGLRNMDRAIRQIGLGAAVSVMMVVVVCFLAWPLAGQHALLAAVRAESRGEVAAASRLYRDAFRLDEWNALQIELRERAGALDAALGRTATPDYEVYSAESLLKQNQTPAAIAKYDALATTHGPSQDLARMRSVSLRAAYGLQLYQTGAFGAAVAAWQSALQREPSMWLAAFYLARGYFAAGRYHEAAQVAQRCISHVDDLQFIANLYSDIGDAGTRGAGLPSGHLAYYLSYQWDYADNRRGLAGATGP